MEIYVACITLLAIVAIVAVLLVAWRRPDRKVTAMLIELVREGQERLTGADSSVKDGRMKPERQWRRPLPQRFDAHAVQFAGQQPGGEPTMADDLNAQTEAENAPEPEQPRERAVF